MANPEAAFVLRSTSWTLRRDVQLALELAVALRYSFQFGCYCVVCGEEYSTQVPLQTEQIGRDDYKLFRRGRLAQDNLANLMALLPNLKHFQGSYMCLPHLLADARDMLSIELAFAWRLSGNDWPLVTHQISYKKLRHLIRANPDLATLALGYAESIFRGMGQAFVVPDDMVCALVDAPLKNLRVLKLTAHLQENLLSELLATYAQSLNTMHLCRAIGGPILSESAIRCLRLSECTMADVTCASLLSACRLLEDFDFDGWTEQRPNLLVMLQACSKLCLKSMSFRRVFLWRSHPLLCELPEMDDLLRFRDDAEKVIASSPNLAHFRVSHNVGPSMWQATWIKQKGWLRFGFPSPPLPPPLPSLRASTTGLEYETCESLTKSWCEHRHY